jgi:hypothetical protein
MAEMKINDPYGILTLPEPTKEEKHIEDFELISRPIDSAAAYDYTEEQLNLRKRIGKRITKKIYEHAMQTKPELANEYLTHPPYLFYTCKNGIAKRRIYGICQYKDGSKGAHAVTAMVMFNNDVVGGVPLSEMVPLEKWSDEHLSFLNSGLIKYKNAFIDPLGFIEFIS